MNKANDNTAAAAPNAPKAPAEPVTKSLNPSDAVAKMKTFLGELVNNNLEMAIGITHLVGIDLERMYADQLRFAELQRAQAMANEIKAKNEAAAAGAKPNGTGVAPEGAAPAAEAPAGASPAKTA